MSEQPRAAHETGPKAERTRATILEAAEQVFAEKGYAAARLDDVARRVGIRRASMVYYFRDKRELHDAVLDDIFGELLDRYRNALSAPVPLPARIEAVIDAWVRYVAERPAVARLLLWASADNSQEQSAVATAQTEAVLSALVSAIEQGQREGCFHPIDPLHFIFTIVGATVFFVAAIPHIVRNLPFDPLSPEQLEAHHNELLEISRRLLGTGAAPSRRPGRSIRGAHAAQAGR